MANYQDKVTIETTVNGQQAEDELKKLRQQAIELKEKIAEVYKTQGKSAAYDSLNKELNKTKRNIVWAHPTNRFRQKLKTPPEFSEAFLFSEPIPGLEPGSALAEKGVFLLLIYRRLIIRVIVLLWRICAD